MNWLRSSAAAQIARFLEKRQPWCQTGMGKPAVDRDTNQTVVEDDRNKHIARLDTRLLTGLEHPVAVQARAARPQVRTWLSHAWLGPDLDLHLVCHYYQFLFFAFSLEGTYVKDNQFLFDSSDYLLQESKNNNYICTALFTMTILFPVRNTLGSFLLLFSSTGLKPSLHSLSFISLT